MKSLSFALVLSNVVLNWTCSSVHLTDYVLPQDYKGEAAVVFGTSDGEKVRFHDRTLQLEIPDSGILYTQAQLEFGKSIDKFIIINDSYHRDTLPELASWEKAAGKKVLFRRILTIYPSDDPESKHEYYAVLFYVGDSLKGTEKERFLFENKLIEQVKLRVNSVKETR